MGYQLPGLDATSKLAAAWFALAILDVLTGWLVAFITRTVSSRVSWRGVMRKVLTAIVLVVVGIVNAIAPAPLDGFPLLVPALIGLIGSETISILENAKRAGVTIPGLTTRLEAGASVSRTVRDPGNPADLSGGQRQSP